MRGTLFSHWSADFHTVSTSPSGDQGGAGPNRPGQVSVPSVVPADSPLPFRKPLGSCPVPSASPSHLLLPQVDEPTSALSPALLKPHSLLVDCCTSSQGFSCPRTSRCQAPGDWRSALQLHTHPPGLAGLEGIQPGCAFPPCSFPPCGFPPSGFPPSRKSREE